MKTKENSGIGLVDIPDEQQDIEQDQIVKKFDLENLGIGGLRAEFAQVFRRAFASRIFPKSIVKKLGIKHVKGVLLFGPPGTGKTLIARKIGEVLNCRPPKIDGPEVFNKFVGGTEENVRKLFAEAGWAIAAHHRQHVHKQPFASGQLRKRAHLEVEELIKCADHYHPDSSKKNRKLLTCALLRHLSSVNRRGASRPRLAARLFSYV